MRIIENTPDRLVAQNKGISGYVTGAVLIIGGIVAVPYGLFQHSVAIWGIGAGIAAFGALALLLTKSELLTADRTSATVTVVLKGLTGQKQASYAFGDIVQVRTIQRYEQSNTANTTNRGAGTGISFGAGNMGGTSSSSMRLVSNTQLVLTSGESVDIEHTSSNATGMLLSNRSSEGIGQVLATVIGKPYQLVAPNMNAAAVVAEVVQAFHGAQTAPSVTPGAPTVSPVSNPVQAAPAPLVPTPQPGNPEAAGFAMPVAAVDQPQTSTPNDQPPQA